MTYLVSVALIVLVVGAVLAISYRLTGLVAEQFGEDPALWQLRLLPLALFGPIVLWLLLSRRGGGGGRWA